MQTKQTLLAGVAGIALIAAASALSPAAAQSNLSTQDQVTQQQQTPYGGNNVPDRNVPRDDDFGRAIDRMQDEMDRRRGDRTNAEDDDATDAGASESASVDSMLGAFDEDRVDTEADTGVTGDGARRDGRFEGHDPGRRVPDGGRFADPGARGEGSGTDSPSERLPEHGGEHRDPTDPASGREAGLDRDASSVGGPGFRVGGYTSGWNRQDGPNKYGGTTWSKQTPNGTYFVERDGDGQTRSVSRFGDDGYDILNRDSGGNRRKEVHSRTDPDSGDTIRRVVEWDADGDKTRDETTESEGDSTMEFTYDTPGTETAESDDGDSGGSSSHDGSSGSDTGDSGSGSSGSSSDDSGSGGSGGSGSDDDSSDDSSSDDSSSDDSSSDDSSSDDSGDDSSSSDSGEDGGEDTESSGSPGCDPRAPSAEGCDDGALDRAAPWRAEQEREQERDERDAVLSGDAVTNPDPSGRSVHGNNPRDNDAHTDPVERLGQPGADGRWGERPGRDYHFCTSFGCQDYVVNPDPTH